jgi:hypothetical protein
MASVAQAGAVNVGTFQAPAFTMSCQVGMSATNRTVINSAVLAGDHSVCLHQLLASDVLELRVHHVFSLSLGKPPGQSFSHLALMQTIGLTSGRHLGEVQAGVLSFLL